MSKRVFVLLIVLMSLSLAGIIFVQAYYIKDAIDNEKARFRFNVNNALYYVSNTVEEEESSKFLDEFQNLKAKGKVDSTSVSRLLIYEINNDEKSALFYRGDVLKENIKLSSPFFDLGLDSLELSTFIGSSTLESYENIDSNNSEIARSPVTRIVKMGEIDEAQRLALEKSFKELYKSKPIYKRVSVEKLENLLSERLKKDSINIDFELAIYSQGLATKVHSKGFEPKEDTFSVPIFTDENNRGLYKLLVNFPDDRKFILSSTLGMVMLSAIFTLVIIIAYASSLYQLVKQRKISEIKTDFINNMTHEFKTPIATINLALDSIKNPKIIGDKDKVMRYLSMIKEENKRMHAQVENVLRISKLEKNELNISKDRIDLHELIEDAITHVSLIVEDRQGHIKTFLEATQTSILANETHFTNVVVNMLDNAIKYSPNVPEIEVYTENVGNSIILKVKDHGRGMSKVAVKRVFEKFYREHTGNIHNVKGHGLGLAYVKRIVEDHQGHVSVESEKDKGSTFIIKLPLIS
ncbi:MAG: sensor histidine kinase [Aestuariibaculum sp.]